MDERARLMLVAEEYLASAQVNLAAGRLHPAFEGARHAAELAGKARLLDTVGDYPKERAIGGRLFSLGLVPPGVSPEALDRFLAQHIRGRYGDDAVDAQAAEEALRMGRLMVAFARR